MAVPNGYNHQFEGTAGSGMSLQLPASGSSVALLNLGSSNFTVSAGTGRPTHPAQKGSIYINVNGSASTDRMFLNTTGSNVWTAVTTAA